MSVVKDDSQEPISGKAIYRKHKILYQGLLVSVKVSRATRLLIE